MMASNGGEAFSRSTENKELIDSHQILHHHQNYNNNNNSSSSSSNNNNNKKGSGGRAAGVVGAGGGGGGAGAGAGAGRNISIAERRAAKCGFNVPNMNLQPRYMMMITTTATTIPSPSPTAVPSPPLPYFTIPPGISPSALLDSPIMLPNAQAAQLSPTTGTFQFPSPNHQSLKLKLKLTANGDSMDVGKDHSCSIPNIQRIPQYSVLNNSRTENKPVDYEFLQQPRDLQEMSIKDCNMQMISAQNHNGKERSIIENVEKQQKGAYFPKEVTKSSEDGYYWRKYGQKHVKGSEYPRSYYKCTNTNCPVRKKVERSHDGQITEIVYKGSHNHPKPLPLKRFGDASEINNQGTNSTTGNVNVAFGSSIDGLNRASSTSLIQNYFSDPLSRSVNGFEPVETQEFSSAFGGQDGDDQDEASPDQSISFNDEDDENDESEPKKRKRDSFSIESNISRSTREPRVVVQIESDIDILDDGYRWRKYGQKVVKGNPNPRSYYKCTSPGCPVRKHVERAANDLKSVITTYEGKHNHEVPTAASASTKNNGSGILISDHHHHLPPNSNTMCLPSASSSITTNHIPSRQGKQFQESSIFNYNHDQLIMRSNLPAPAGNFFNFGSSSINYPLSFPPFHYGSVLMNGNSCIKNYQSNTNLYPMTLPDYITTNPVQGSGISGNNLYYNNYASQPPGSNQGQEIRECHTKILKPKEEKRDEGDNIYDSCLSIPNHGNGIM